MRTGAIVAVLLLGLCATAAQCGVPGWVELLDRADSLASAGHGDAALEAMAAARLEALGRYSESDTTVEISIFEDSTHTAYYMASYEEAEMLLKRTLSLKEQVLGGEHLEVAGACMDLARLYRMMQRFPDALELYTRALSLRVAALGPDDVLVAFALEGTADIEMDTGSYDRALEHYRRALEIFETTGEPDPVDIARNLSNLGNICWYKGEYAEGIPYYERALAMFEEAQGPDHPDVAAALNNLANTYARQGKFRDAEPLYLRALSIRETALGPDHPDVALSLNCLAFTCDRTNRYSDAMELYNRALAIRLRAYGRDHVAVAMTMNNIGTVYMAMGNFTDALGILLESLEIRRGILGPEHPDVGQSLNNIGICYEDMGKYYESERYLRQALEVWEKALGPEHPKVPVALSNLAIVCRKQSRSEEAEELYLRAVELSEKSLGPDHPRVAFNLNNLALLYIRMGRYDEAGGLLERALAIREKTYGPDHVRVAESLEGLADVRKVQGHSAQGDSLLERALEIKADKLGTGHPKYLNTLAMLAQSYLTQGRLGEAAPLCRTTLETRRSIYAPDHPELALALDMSCKLCRLQGECEEAITLAEESCRIRRKNFVENSAAMSEGDALRYSDLMRLSTDLYLSCYISLESPDTSHARTLADVVLSTKGEVSDGMFERQRGLIAERDSVTLELAESLRSAKFQLSRLFVKGPDKDLESYRAHVDSLSAVARQLDGELSSRSASYRRQLDYRDITASRIAGLIPQDAAVVEYVKFINNECPKTERTPAYFAIVLDRSDRPECIYLGEAAQIEDAVSEYRRHMLAMSSAGRMPSVVEHREYVEIAHSLTEKIWAPVAELLEDRELVFIAPDGALNLVSFAGLLEGSGEYIGEHIAVHYLSSGRDLIRFTQEPSQAQGLLALGDPDYDAPIEVQAGRRAEPAQPLVRAEAALLRSSPSGCASLRELKVKPLPGTRKEIDLVGARWEQISREPLTTLMGTAASEERFKAEAPGNRVIHLATHGYYLEAACQRQLPADLMDARSAVVGENPLLFSGLFLAGANRREQTADMAGAEDGVLTAYEVSAMDLAGTELVVLSACETGLGEVKEGEGVYGLRRAFQVAGAQTVVSALWPISDEAAADMMSRLYDRHGEPVPETMRRLQLAAIQDLRCRGLPDHPYTWASFIALGDWR